MQGHYFACKELLLVSASSHVNSLAHPQTFVTVTLALQVLCWRLVFRPNCCMHDVSLTSSVYVTCPPVTSLCSEVDRHGAFPSLMFLRLRSIYSVGMPFCSIFREGSGPTIRVCNRNVYISYMAPDCLGIDYGLITHIFRFCLIMIT